MCLHGVVPAFAGTTLSSLPVTNAKRLRKGANGSRECAPNDGLRDEAIHACFLVTSWIASLALAMTIPHTSRALLNANDDTRLVFSSRISVRVIGGSARWLQFSRSQSRQLTPIGVPSVFSRSMPVA